MAAIITLGNLKDYLQAVGSGRDAKLQLLVDGVNDVVTEETGRDWTSKARDEYYAGSGTSRLVLAHYPIQSVSDISEDGTDVDHTDTEEVEIEHDRGILIRVNGVWWKTEEKVYRIQYTGGPASIPSDLKLAALDMAAWVYRQTGGLSSESSMSESMQLAQDSLLKLPAVRGTLERRSDAVRGYVSKRDA